MFQNTRTALATIWAALDGLQTWPDRVRITGEGDLASVFPVTDLAAASVGAACLAVAELVETRGVAATPAVDRRLASFWFARSIVPQGWEMAPPWDAIAGDYQAADGWVKLHTNAPHHRAAALSVLEAEGTHEAVAQAVRGWRADDLEAAIVERGGCAAAMRSLADWSAHEQGRAVGAEPLLHRSRGTPGRCPRGLFRPTGRCAACACWT